MNVCFLSLCPTGLPSLEVQQAGTAIVSSSTFTSSTVTVRDKGQLVLVGPGTYGMDLAYLSLAENKEGRDGSLKDTLRKWPQTSSLLSSAPQIWASITTMRMFNGSFTVASLYSNVSITKLFWEGGDLSGRANFRLLSSASINNTATAKGN